MPAVINAGVLKDVVEAIRMVTDEAKLRFDTMGLGVTAVDQANVAMVALSLDPRAFESYELEEMVIAIGMDRLKDILSSSGNDDKIELNINTDTRKLEIRNGCYFYVLSLLDPTSVRREPKPPKFELPATIVLNGGALRDIVHEAGKVADKVTLSAEKGAFKAVAEDELDSFTAEVPESELISMELKQPAKACFSLDYLGSLCKALGKSESVTLNLGNELPVKLSSSFAGGKGTLTYFVAPWVEGEG